MALKYQTVASLYEKLREGNKISRCSLRLFSAALTKIYECHCQRDGSAEAESVEDLLQLFDFGKDLKGEYDYHYDEEMIVDKSAPEGSEFRAIGIQSGYFLREAWDFDPLAHLVLEREETGLSRRLVIRAADYVSLTGVACIGVEVGLNFSPEFRFQECNLDNLQRVIPEIRNFLGANSKVFAGGLFFEDSLDEAQMNLKNLLDKKATDFLKKYLADFLKECYDKFRAKHSYMASMNLMARLISEIYENGDLEWLRRRNDLYGVQMYDMYDYCLLNMALSYMSEADARGCCQMFFRDDHESNIFADFDENPAGAFVRFGHVDLIKKIASCVDAPGHQEGCHLCLVCNSPNESEFLRDLMEDVVRFYENEGMRSFSDCRTFLFSQGKFYKGSLICRGVPMADLLESEACPLYYTDGTDADGLEDVVRKILIVDESLQRCWQDFPQTALRLREHAHKNNLCILWFRSIENQELASCPNRVPGIDSCILVPEE